MYKHDFKEFAREGEQITINESVYIPSMLPEHTHNFLEIFYMTEWHGQHEINGHWQPIREGELNGAKTHTILYQINKTEYYCQVDLPLSDYPLYGKQLAANHR